MLNIFFWCYFLSLLQVIIIVFLTGSLSLVTVVGNILVLLSFKVNKALKTVNNYYLLSLAFADLTIGTLSMNLYTTYIIMDQWALGPVVCDLWLAIDYVASNASVMNLLVISFDRYCLQKRLSCAWKIYRCWLRTQLHQNIMLLDHDHSTFRFNLVRFSWGTYFGFLKKRWK